VPDPEVLEIVERVTAAAGMRRRAISDDEIRERTIYALINEGARLLEEGVAQRAADIDVIYLTGYGFPAFRGGPMFHADSVGLDRVFERVSAFGRDLGARWTPAPLLERLASEDTQSGGTFRSVDERSARR
jgi:3-hydroxyacyl-CoA dehydrogenase